MGHSIHLFALPIKAQMAASLRGFSDRPLPLRTPSLYLGISTASGEPFVFGGMKNLKSPRERTRTRFRGQGL